MRAYFKVCAVSLRVSRETKINLKVPPGGSLGHTCWDLLTPWVPLWLSRQSKYCYTIHARNYSSTKLLPSSLQAPRVIFLHWATASTGWRLWSFASPELRNGQIKNIYIIYKTTYENKIKARARANDTSVGDLMKGEYAAVVARMSDATLEKQPFDWLCEVATDGGWGGGN